jgi:Peroxidase, family 2
LRYNRPHDGKELNASIITHALEEGYGLSDQLANFLVIGGIALLGQVGSFGLNDLARHNRIEHDASLVHDDTKPRDEYAPIPPNPALVKQFFEEVKDGQFVTVEDVARARVWRESQCPVLNRFQAEIARGEMAIALGLFSQPESETHRQGIPVDMLRAWFSEERLPDGWKPSHTQGLFETIEASTQLRNEMKKIVDSGEDVTPVDSETKE